MSELKAFDIVVAEEGYGEGIVKYRRAVYDKSEVDKVIAEKDKEIALLKERICNGDVSRVTWIDDCIAKDKVIADLEENHKKEVEQLLILNREQANAANRLRDIMERVIRHNKYKRCLTMARWCEIQFAYYIASCDRYDGKYVNKKARHFYKWKYKWLELAEKFKEAK